MSVMTVAETTAALIAADRDALVAILPRVSAMNSFLRSEACRRHYWRSSIGHVVYHYKREAILQAHRLGMATHRRADVTVKCRDCGGTGKYSDTWGQTHDHCWHCSSTGYAELVFVETTLPGVVWLSPYQRCFDFVTRVAELPPTDQNWQVNQPGVDLTPSQVADHMNEIEAFFPKRPPVQYGEWNDFDVYASYSIWVGETRPGACALCCHHLEPHYGGHGVSTGRLIWNARVCERCRTKCSPGEIFNVLSRHMPAEFITPEIRRWVERHPVMEKAHA